MLWYEKCLLLIIHAVKWKRNRWWLGRSREEKKEFQEGCWVCLMKRERRGNVKREVECWPQFCVGLLPCRRHAWWWWYKPHRSGLDERRRVEDVVRRVQMQVLRALVVARWGSLLAVKWVVARDLGGERGTVTIELSGARRLRSVVAEWVVVNFNLASLDLLGGELAAVASLVHLLVRRAVVGVWAAAVTVGGRCSLAVHVSTAQDLGALSVEPVAKVAAHALGLGRSDVSVVAVGSLVALTVKLRSRTSKALAVAASVRVVGERRSEALGRRLDAVLLRSDNPGREAGYATIELLDLGLDAAAVRSVADSR